MEDIKSSTLNKPDEKINKDKTAKAKFTGEGDILTRATVGDARIYVARTTRLVRKLSLRHNLSHLATAALGRTVTGALLLAATMRRRAHPGHHGRSPGRHCPGLCWQPGCVSAAEERTSGCWRRGWKRHHFRDPLHSRRETFYRNGGTGGRRNRR